MVEFVVTKIREWRLCAQRNLLFKIYLTPFNKEEMPGRGVFLLAMGCDGELHPSDPFGTSLGVVQSH